MLPSIPSLQVAVTRPGRKDIPSERIEPLRQRLFTEQDTVTVLPSQALAEDVSADLLILFGICGSSPLAAQVIARQIPCLVLEPHLTFHPYHAAFTREVQAGGGIILPATTPEEIAASIQAVRARKQLRGTSLLVVDTHEDDFRADEVRRFAAGCRERLGVEIIRRSVDELNARAAAYLDTQADAELQRWYREVLEGAGEMNGDHMRQVARLYLAERELLQETGAVGISVEDIFGFLLIEPRAIMPNVSYGPLASDGYLVTEEGDVEVLTAELLLQAALGTHPTMSNIYLSYRDAFTAHGSEKGYSIEMKQADYRQCLADNHVTVSHFSAAGVLPPNMMEEPRYRVRETLPAWPGQSMVTATPKLGPVALARLTPDADGVHLLPGEITARRQGDQYGWYRNSCFVKLPSVADFVARCLHHHYAIGQENDRQRTLQILCEHLLRLRMV